MEIKMEINIEQVQTLLNSYNAFLSLLRKNIKNYNDKLESLGEEYFDTYAYTHIIPQKELSANNLCIYHIETKLESLLHLECPEVFNNLEIIHEPVTCFYYFDIHYRKYKTLNIRIATDFENYLSELKPSMYQMYNDYFIEIKNKINEVKDRKESEREQKMQQYLKLKQELGL